MNVYIFQAALICEEEGERIREELTAQGKAPADPDDEYSYDSDDFPKGPYPNGGGEADTPQHCDITTVFLENPLTPEGEQYVLEAWRERIETGVGNPAVLMEWLDYYDWLWRHFKEGYEARFEALERGE